MYSAKISPPNTSWRVSDLSRRNASKWSRTDSLLSSGMPMSMPTTRVGMIAPRSAAKSKWPVPTSGSSSSAHIARISGSSPETLRGVNIRESRLRWIVCVGGSSKINVPGGNSTPAFSRSSVTPRLEMNVSRSMCARSTSSKRLSP